MLQFLCMGPLPLDKMLEYALDVFTNERAIRGWYVRIPRILFKEMVREMTNTVRFTGQEFSMARGEMEFRYLNDVKLISNDLLNINMEEFYAKNSNK